MVEIHSNIDIAKFIHEIEEHNDVKFSKEDLEAFQDSEFNKQYRKLMSSHIGHYKEKKIFRWL